MSFFVTYSYRSEDTVSVRVSPTKEDEFLLSASCCPWRRRVYPKVGHYVNVNHAWMAPRLCVCVCVCHAVWPSHGFTFHPNYIGASGLLSALIELTCEEQSLFEESAGILRRHHLAVGAVNGVYIRSVSASEKRGFSFRRVYSLVTVGQEWLRDTDLPKHGWWVKQRLEESEEDIYHSLRHLFPSFFPRDGLTSSQQTETHPDAKQTVSHAFLPGIKEPWDSNIWPASDKMSEKSKPVILMGYTFAVTG